MNLDEIDKKCFILALFIRDDGQRFLLGSGAYEFKDSQLHFSANTMANDVVEVQGNDGYLLAGQVRRPTTQVFDGYIGDASINKPDIEGYRRDFFAFFQKNHFYTVVYIFPDGTAIQRRRGFIVDASEVRELYQMFPEYHIGLNFEDVNYYKYSEDEDGHEQYAKSIDINISKAVTGGLIWDSVSQTQAYNHGTDFSISGTIENEPVDYIDLYGDTEQTTYSGKNLLNVNFTGSTSGGVTITNNRDGTVTAIGTTTGPVACNLSPASINNLVLQNGKTYTQRVEVISGNFNLRIVPAFKNSGGTVTYNYFLNNQSKTTTDTMTCVGYDMYTSTSYLPVGSSVNFTIRVWLEEGSDLSSPYEPYVGGTASPNPDYPQEVQTVTGEQTITVSNGQGGSQVYPINLGKNLCNPSDTKSAFVYADFGRAAYGAGDTSVIIPVLPNTDYTISTLATQSRYRGGFSDSIPVSGGGDVTVYNGFNKDSQLVSVTTNSGDHKYLIVNATDLTKIQIEKGSVATTYAPYFTPIELCKIGTYQDYIYKSGEDWYIKKNIKKLDMSTINAWARDVAGRFYRTGFSSAYGIAPGVLYSNDFTYSATAWSGEGKFGLPDSGNIWLMISDTTVSQSDLPTWLGNKGAIMYGVISTPTDTQITNADLIAQLEALNSATTYAGVTWFKTESEYLPADTWAYVQIQAGGGVVWDNYGATWEEGGGGMIVNVNVDSIENVYPVWTVNGPTDTPILTNLTTGTSITYNGNITASQTLVVDMLNQTALLNGTSVIGKLSGDWIELAPGMNRMSYTATNEQTAPKSTLEWQEIVG